MGAVEQDIDRYAEELSELDAFDEQVEKAWEESRDTLCETLAAGKPLFVQGKTILTKYDLVDGMFDHYPDEANEAVIQALTDPDSGLPEVGRIARLAAEKLVDDFSDRFKQDIESDIRKGDAA